MRGHISYKALIAGMTAIAVSAGTVLAQSDEVTSGVRMTLDVIQRFSAGDNLSRVTNPTDNGFLSSTELNFGVTSETRTQSLSLDLGAVARLGDLPDEGGSVSDVTNPYISLGFQQRAANSTLSFNASYREVDLSDDVVTILDLESLELIDVTLDNGTREQTSADLRFVAGTGGPVETDLRLRWNSRKFDSTNASFLDQDQLRFDGSVRLAATRNTDVIVGLSAVRTETFDTTTRTVDETEASIGAITQVRPGTTLSFTLGSSVIDVDDGPVQTSDGAMTGRVALTQDMPNGDLGVVYARGHSTAGTRDSLQFTRSLELPSGSLDLAVGASKATGTDVQPTASVRYQQNFKQGAFIADLTQSVSGNTAGEEFRTAAGGLRYVHALTPLAQLDLSFRLTDVEQIAGGTEERQRTSTTIAVNYDLTEDWALTAGYRHEEQTSNAVQTLESNEVFATFRRSFDVRF